MKFFYLLFLLSITLEYGYCKKDVSKMTDKEIEELYEEWERNDEDKLEEDEKPPYLQKKPSVDFEELKKMSKDPDDLMRLSKKGQSIMMFVSVVDPSSTKKPSKSFTNRLSILWQSMLNNNHIEVQVYVIEDDRILFMFTDGSRAWEARDFLITQKECKETTLEGKTIKGLGANQIKKDL